MVGAFQRPYSLGTKSANFSHAFPSFAYWKIPASGREFQHVLAVRRHSGLRPDGLAGAGGRFPDIAACRFAPLQSRAGAEAGCGEGARAASRPALDTSDAGSPARIPRFI